MKNQLNYLLIAILATVIFACGGKKQTEEKVTTANVREAVEREFKYPIPTSYEITQFIQDADVAFVMNVTNPVENVEKYETERDKALNLGIYGADLSYASTYNMQEETMALFNATRSLIDGLSVPGVFNDDMAARIEQNLANKDSLILIITESFYNTYDQLNKAGQDKLGFLVVSASWIEALYITTQLAVSSDYDQRLMSIVANQKNTANILSEAAAKYIDDEDVKAVSPLINFMKLSYDGVDPEVGITEGQLNDIMTNVESTRSEIVN